MEKSIKLTVRAGNTWKISRTIRRHADGVRALVAVEAKLQKHKVFGTLTCKTENGSLQMNATGYNSHEAVLAGVEEFMKSEGLLPSGAAAYAAPPEETARTVREAHERGYALAMKYANSLALEREERAALEAAGMHEIALGVWYGLTHVRTVCELLSQSTLRALDMFGKSHSIVHAVLDPVIAAEDALQSMLHRLISDADELTDMLDAVADPCENALSQTSDRHAQG